MKCTKKLTVLALTAISLYGLCSNRIDASTVTKSTNYWNMENGSLYIDSSSGGSYYNIVGNTRESDNCISVSNRNVKLVLDNVDINTGYLVAPLEVGSGATVTLELVGHNKISGDYGILVNQGGVLNIEGDGILEIEAESSAAIGNVMYSAFGLGNINIRGGEIYAKSNFGSAIGTCRGTDPNGNSSIGNISITGGYVEAYGSEDSAAIGAGIDSTYNNIYIGGDAVVKAIGTSGGAGIGGGLEKDLDLVTYGNITIAENATVEAYSYYGAGIGSGRKEVDDVSTINIEVKDSASVYSESQWGEAIGNGVSSKFKVEESLIDKVENVQTTASVTQLEGETVEEFMEAKLFTVNNKHNIKLLDNSSVSCVSYYNKAVGDTDSDIVILDFESVPLNDTSIKLTSENHSDVVIEIPSMCSSVATKLDEGKYICEVDEFGVELDEKSKETFNPVVVSNNGERNLVELVSSAEVLPEEVYVDNVKGSNSNTGFSKDEPIKDFDKAYKRVATNGTIVVCGTTEINADIDRNKNISITSRDADNDYREHGVELLVNFDTIDIRDNIKFSSINVNMKDSNLNNTQIACLKAENTIFRKSLDSKAIRTSNMINLADTKTNIDYSKNNDIYILCWSDTYRQMFKDSLKGQILCMNDVEPQWYK